MEALTIALSAIFGLLSPVGLILDGAIETAIRDRFESVEDLRVRLDNAPSHQILQGRVDRLRIAGRGLILKSIPLRIAILELETDPIDLDRQNIDEGFSEALQQPLHAGIRLVVTEDDLDRGFSGDAQKQEWAIGNYTFLNPQIDFLSDDRLRVRVKIREGDDPSPSTTQLAIESGLTVREGRYIALVDPQIQVDEETVPPPLLDTIFGGVDRVIDLERLTPSGTLVRILKLELTPDRLELAAFVRIEGETND